MTRVHWGLGLFVVIFTVCFQPKRLGDILKVGIRLREAGRSCSEADWVEHYSVHTWPGHVHGSVKEGFWDRGVSRRHSV